MFENFSPTKRPSDPRFGPGPSLIFQEDLQKLADTGFEYMGTSHRRPAFKNVVKEVQEGLKEYFQVPKGYEVILGNGGATFFFDMQGLGLVKKSAHHFVCGEFSQKWFQADKKIPWIETQATKANMGEAAKLESVEADFVCATLNETSTGVMLDKLPEKTDHNLVSIDATSGGGQCPCPLDRTDIFFFSPQKIFASDGGLWVAIMSPRALARAQELEESENYRPAIMSFKLAIDNSLKNQTYNTPAAATFFLMNQQIKRMNKLGQNKIESLAKAKAQTIYDWADNHPLVSPFVKQVENRSMAVATLDFADSVPVDDLTKRFRELKVAYDIEAYRKLGRNQLRIALFHNISHDDLERLINSLDEAIRPLS